MADEEYAIEFANVCYRTSVRKGLFRREHKWILSGVSGYARKGRFLGIMGAPTTARSAPCMWRGLILAPAASLHPRLCTPH